VKGDIIVSRGAVGFGVGVADNGAMPWRLYRAMVDGTNQWRLELGNKGEFSVGYFSEKDRRYNECLTISDSCKVTITGDLHVTGKICGNLPSAQISQQAVALATSTYLAPILGQTAMPRLKYISDQLELNPLNEEIKSSVIELVGLIPSMNGDGQKNWLLRYWR